MPAKKANSDRHQREIPEKFTPKSNDIVYEYFIYNYLTHWYHAKTVSSDVYSRASKELSILQKWKDKKDGKVVKGSSPGIAHVYDSSCLSHQSKCQSKDEQHIAERPPKAHSATSAPRIQPSQESSSQMRRLEQQNVTLQEEINSLKEDLSESYAELREKSAYLRRIQEDLKNSIQEADDLKMRLSKLAGDKLRDNNPDLADLSDPDRPTELGKRFSEIYDNEWSDAFENILGKNEEEKVRLLHELVMSSFQYCDEKLRCQLPEIRKILLQESGYDVDETKKTKKTENIHQTIKEFRKRFARQTAKNVAKNFEEERLEDLLQIDLKDVHNSLRKYVSKCTEICWFMVVCDPSMVLSEDKKGMEFNTDVYKPYTKSLKGIQSPVVELNVWPALHLHYGGPLVAKGVAQPGTKAKK